MIVSCREDYAPDYWQLRTVVVLYWEWLRHIHTHTHIIEYYAPFVASDHIIGIFSIIDPPFGVLIVLIVLILLVL